jgi:uncharacterized repeat protein (TIGR01451 family)
VGTNFDYSLRVTNNRPSDAIDVIVNDLLPAGVTYSKSTPDIRTYNKNTGIWTVGSLTSGKNASLSLVVTVNALPDTMITNTAQITGNDIDPVSNNNIASQNTRVRTAVVGEITGISKSGICSPWLALYLLLPASGILLFSRRRKKYQARTLNCRI